MTTELVAFLGTALIAVAYIPQIVHLIAKHCAYGMSVKAWLMWLVGSILIFPHTLSLGEPVYIILIGLNIVATLFILTFSYFHQGEFCPEHKKSWLTKSRL